MGPDILHQDYIRQGISRSLTTQEPCFMTGRAIPFDKLVAANTSIDNNLLITKDDFISGNYMYAAF
jgi:hypothetical protein